tara:strand:+ start:1465 stop:1791 length:327 start_codon:yes stop_codon:yes gene_type:complete
MQFTATVGRTSKGRDRSSYTLFLTDVISSNPEDTSYNRGAVLRCRSNGECTFARIYPFGTHPRDNPYQEQPLIEADFEQLRKHAFRGLIGRLLRGKPQIECRVATQTQ